MNLLQASVGPWQKDLVSHSDSILEGQILVALQSSISRAFDFSNRSLRISERKAPNPSLLLFPCFRILGCRCYTGTMHLTFRFSADPNANYFARLSSAGAFGGAFHHPVSPKCPAFVSRNCSTTRTFISCV
jgi:hypothetical protein